MIWKLKKKKEKTSIYRYELFFLWTWHTHTQDAWMESNRWKVVLAFAIYRSRFIIKYTHFIRASCLFSCLLLHIFSNMWVICAHIDVAFFIIIIIWEKKKYSHSGSFHKMQLKINGFCFCIRCFVAIGRSIWFL